MTQTTRRPITVWENPPDFKWCLVVTLLVTFGCCIVPLSVGADLLRDPDVLLRSYLVELQGRLDSVALPLCGSWNGTVSLCPTTWDTSSKHLLPNGWLTWFSGLLFGSGQADFFICVLATVAALRGDKLVLAGSLILMPASIAVKWRLVDEILFVRAPVHEAAKDELVQLYRDQYTINPDEMNSFTTTLNTIMVTAGCCGIASPSDARFIEPVKLEGPRAISPGIEYPPACCLRPDVRGWGGKISPNDPVRSIFDDVCLSMNASWNINSEGCFHKVFRDMFERNGKGILAVLLILITLQSAQTIFTVLMLLKRETIPIKIREKPKDPPARVVSKSSSMGIRKVQVRALKPVEKTLSTCID